MRIRIIYTGRSYQTAENLPDEITLAEEAVLEDALHAIRDCLPQGEELPPTCLVSLAGQHRGTVANHTGGQLSDGDELVLIAPVAGG